MRDTSSTTAFTNVTTHPPHCTSHCQNAFYIGSGKFTYYPIKMSRFHCDISCFLARLTLRVNISIYYIFITTSPNPFSPTY